MIKSQTPPPAPPLEGTALYTHLAEVNRTNKPRRGDRIQAGVKPLHTVGTLKPRRGDGVQAGVSPLH